MAVRVRAATAADLPFALALVPRLRAFGRVPLRTPEAHDRAEREALERALLAPAPDAVVHLAELDDLGPVGIAYAQSATDYFSGERHGHLAILAVSEAGEGQGAGRALLAATEAWARARGYGYLSLNVFAANRRARAVYERAGFAPDTLRYAKTLAPAAPGPAEAPAG